MPPASGQLHRGKASCHIRGSFSTMMHTRERLNLLLKVPILRSKNLKKNKKKTTSNSQRAGTTRELVVYYSTLETCPSIYGTTVCGPRILKNDDLLRHSHFLVAVYAYKTEFNKLKKKKKYKVDP